MVIVIWLNQNSAPSKKCGLFDSQRYHPLSKPQHIAHLMHCTRNFPVYLYPYPPRFVEQTTLDSARSVTSFHSELAEAPFLPIVDQRKQWEKRVRLSIFPHRVTFATWEVGLCW